MNRRKKKLFNRLLNRRKSAANKGKRTKQLKKRAANNEKILEKGQF